MAPKPLNIKRECTHGGTHKHGTPVMYNRDKCRCPECRTARVSSDRKRFRAVAYGRWEQPFVDAHPVRTHVRKLQHEGMALPDISKRSGVNMRVIRSLLYGSSNARRVPSRTLRRDNAEALLAVRPTQSSRKPMDATGAQRRIQALIYNGWSQFAISKEAGFHVRMVWQILNNDCIYLGTHERIKDAYDRLWDKEPPCGNRQTNRGIAMAKTMARANGWLPPLAWDDESIDDPRAIPAPTVKDSGHMDPIRVELATHGRIKWRDLTKPERVEAIAYLARHGMSDGDIARRLNTYTEAIFRERVRHGIGSRWAA